MQIEVRKADMGKEKKRLKVCAYARVSTEASEQENSLENQVSHYTEMIQSNPAYESQVFMQILEFPVLRKAALSFRK